jgi:beta-lactamase class A
MKSQPQKMVTRSLALVLGGLLILALLGDVILLYKNHVDQSRTFAAAAIQYPYLDPAQGFYQNSDLIVNLLPLRQELNALIASSSNITMYFEYLNTGANININPTPFFLGSLMKIPVAMAVMKKVDDGQWSLDDQLILADADKNGNYGTLYQDPAGTTFTVAQLLQYMLVDSDDTARAIFIRNLGDQDIENVLDYLGLQDIFNTSNQITAQRYSNFFRALYEASYLSPGSSQYLLSLMNTPHDQELLRAGIPAQIQFAHKIGVASDTYSDAGIVYPPNRPYLLVLAVHNTASTTQVSELMNQVSADIYNFVTQNEQ